MGLLPELLILTRSDPHRMPPVSRLESTALHLEARGDLRTLICYVERWSEQARPTIKARIAQARAFIGLGLMDRAWTRLQDLVETGEGGVEAIAAAAELYLRRGWFPQGRALIQRAMGDYPDDPRLASLWVQLVAPAPPPDLEAADRDDASDEQLLAIVDHYMASGAFIKARVLLERLKRAGRSQGRVADLLWALDGDFRIPGTLGQLTDAYGPDLSFLGELTDLAADSEHTAEADREDLPDHDPEPKPGAFPSLFRHLSAGTSQIDAPDDEPEVTQVSSMAEIDEMRHASVEYTETGGDDTQIMRVIHKQSDPTPPRPSGPDSLSFDLTALQRDLEPPPVSDTDFIDGDFTDPRREAEDDDLIIRTHHDTSDASPAPASPSGGLRLEPEPEPAPSRAVRLSDEDEAWARPEPAPEPPRAATPTPRPAPARSSGRPELPADPHRAAPWALLLVGAGLLFLGLTALLIALVQLARSFFL